MSDNVSYTPPPYSADSGGPGDHSSDQTGIISHHTADDLNWGTLHAEDYWYTFFSEDIYPVSSDDFHENPNYYHGVFGTYFRDFLHETDTQTTSAFEAWLENHTRAQLRFYSPYLWLYEILISYVSTIQDSTIYEADRSQYLTTAQQEAVSSLNNLKFQTNSSSNATKQAKVSAENQIQQAYMQIYLGYKSMLSDYTESISNQITSTNNNQNSLSSLMSAIIEQMQEMVSGIFKSA